MEKQTVCETLNTRSINVHNCTGLPRIDMPHVHHATAVTDMTHSSHWRQAPMKSNLQLYKIMTDVLWVYQDNCSPET